MRLYLEGTTFRHIGCLLGVNHQLVVNWVNTYHVSLPRRAASRRARDARGGRTVHLRRQKNAGVRRESDGSRDALHRGAAVCDARTPELIVVDAAPRAARYYSDAFNTYRELCWWGAHAAMCDKSQTYSVEGTNADLRHYLARCSAPSRAASARSRVLWTCSCDATTYVSKYPR